MVTVSKAQLKAKMLEYFRHVEQTGEELVVTNHGQPTLRVVPFTKRLSPDEAFGILRERAAEYGSVVEPETDDWEDS